MPRRATLLAASLLTAGCAATPKTTTPAPTTPVVEAPPVEPLAASVAPPNTEMQHPLPMRFLLPNAGSVVVVDVTALRELGLRESLRFALRELTAEDPKGCLDRLLTNTRRLVMSSEILDAPKVTVVESPLPPEEVLDCLAASVPDAEAMQVGNLPGLRVNLGSIVTQLEGQLLVGNESGLRVLQGLPALEGPPAEAPNPMHPDEDFMLPMRPKPEVTDVIPQLALEPGVLVTGAMANPGSFSPIGRTRMVVRETPEGIDAFLHFDLASAPPDPNGSSAFAFPEELFNQGRDEILSHFEDEDHLRPLAALLESARIERQRDGVRIALHVPAPRATVPLLEAAAHHELTQRGLPLEGEGPPDPGKPAQER